MVYPSVVTPTLMVGDAICIRYKLNDPVPIANDDHPAIENFTPIIIPVLDNDTALIDVPLEITVVSDPEFGTLHIVNPGNSITFTPSKKLFLVLINLPTKYVISMVTAPLQMCSSKTRSLPR